jgi:hypothetical protein
VNRTDLREFWEAKAEEWSRLRAIVDGHAICQEFLTQLERLWSCEDAAEVSLSEASALTGYSEDHLRRLAREEKLNAHRRGSKLFFQATDLPRKPAKVARTTTVRYDPEADARRVAARRTTGEDAHGTQTAA